MIWADRILGFNQSLELTARLPDGVVVMNPFRNRETFSLCTQFYKKYYSDNNPRRLILGINPGRHGAGLTGIPFTDPIKLEENCGIPNQLPRKPELSADFIYKVIAVYGGPEKFYSRFYFSSVSPLGFVKDGKNLNYYDIRELQEVVYEFFMKTIKQQIDFGIDTTRCYCLGEGKNVAFLHRINKETHLFGEIVSLPHPRFIMQYRRKQVDQYIQLYLERLS